VECDAVDHGRPEGDIRIVTSERGPNIRFPPPAVYVAVFLIGLLLERFWRIPIVGDLRAPLLSIFGLALVGLGVFVTAWGMLTFRRYKTSILPFRPAAALAMTGPYRFTRNPMYLGLTTTHIGAALAMNAGWPLILLPVALYVIIRFVIRVEEEYLGQRFGVEYDDFKRRVRRWL
jgi:protein-S-isoprenylcysteine O-methyltransferase Ste14